MADTRFSISSSLGVNHVVAEYSVTRIYASGRCSAPYLSAVSSVVIVLVVVVVVTDVDIVDVLIPSVVAAQLAIILDP